MSFFSTYGRLNYKLFKRKSIDLKLYLPYPPDDIIIDTEYNHAIIFLRLIGFLHDIGKGFLKIHETPYDEIKYKRYPCNSDEIICKINGVSIEESHIINSFSLYNGLLSNNNEINLNNTKTIYSSNNSNLSYSRLIDLFQITINKLILLCLYLIKSPLDYYFEY